MRRASWRIGIAALILAAFTAAGPAVRARPAQPMHGWAAGTAAHAQAAARAFAPACSVVLRLTPQTFSLVYVARTGDDSEVGYDNAAAYWARCKQHANAAALGGDATMAARIARLGALFTSMQGAESKLAMLREGGGTLYSHVYYRAATDRETRLGDLVALTRTGLAAPAAAYGQIIDPLLSSIADRLSRVQHPSKADLQFTTRVDWDRAASAYVRSVRAVETAAGSGNDPVRASILDFANQPLFLDLPNG